MIVSEVQGDIYIFPLHILTDAYSAYPLTSKVSLSYDWPKQTTNRPSVLQTETSFTPDLHKPYQQYLVQVNIIAQPLLYCN